MQKAKIVLLCSLIKSLLFAQTDFNQKHHYTSLDGLSNNKVTGITKDKSGFIWASTWGGINDLMAIHLKNIIHFTAPHRV